MDTMLPLILGSIKALVLLVIATGAAIVLHKRSARVRAVVWSIALAGCLAIPVLAPLVPAWSLPMPESLARFTISEEAPREITVGLTAEITEASPTEIRIPTFDVTRSDPAPATISWQTWALSIWALGVAILLGRLTLGLWRVSSALRKAKPVTEPSWIWQLDRARARVRCNRTVRLLVSSEIEIPATVGVFRPAIVLPLRANTWLDDRRCAVLLHELIHIKRLDWPARMIARITRAAYWFNPLAWWAVRRLDLEQELACDEEVLSLGTGASDYACHLLGIARHALPTPAPAIPALGMARRTHLEERIMTILKRTTHRRVGMAVIIPAAIIMAAMVPALAAVYPSDPAPRTAGPELKALMTEMKAVEAKMAPHLEAIEEITVSMEPHLEMLEEIEITIDESKLAELEERMEPYLERMATIEIEMAPFEAQMEEFEEHMQNITIHIEDGTLSEIGEQIEAQVSIHMEMIEDIQVDMEPFLEQMEVIHIEMEGLHEQMADIHIDMEPFNEHMAKIQIEMEPFHEQMEQFHIHMEPFEEEMELLGDRLENALRNEVAAALRSELGAVTAPGTDFSEAASRIVEDANIHINDDVIRIKAPRSDTRDILIDLFSEERIGTQDVFDQAIENAVAGLTPMVIQVD